MLLRSSVEPGSPSLRSGPQSPSVTYVGGCPAPAGAASGSSQEPDSPSQTIIGLSAPRSEEPEEEPEEAHRGSRRAGRVTMTQASFPRASRAARANDPGENARSVAYGVVIDGLKEIKRLNLEKAPKDYQAFRSHKLNISTGGRGPGVRTSLRDQGKMNHLAVHF